LQEPANGGVEIARFIYTWRLFADVLELGIPALYTERVSARWQNDRRNFDNDFDGAHLIDALIVFVTFSK
jgi:hypothetical protein